MNRRVVLSGISSHVAGPCPLILLLLSSAALGCAIPSGQAKTAASTAAIQIDCAPPVGRIHTESCADVADDFGAPSIEGAMTLAQTGPDAQVRIEAVRAVDELANAIKAERVSLCEEYDRCGITPKAHLERDRALAEIRTALFRIWNGRQSTEADDVRRLASEVRVLRSQLDSLSGDVDRRREDVLALQERTRQRGRSLLIAGTVVLIGGIGASITAAALLPTLPRHTCGSECGTTGGVLFGLPFYSAAVLGVGGIGTGVTLITVGDASRGAAVATPSRMPLIVLGPMSAEFHWRF